MRRRCEIGGESGGGAAREGFLLLLLVIHRGCHECVDTWLQKELGKDAVGSSQREVARCGRPWASGEEAPPGGGGGGVEGWKEQGGGGLFLPLVV